MTRLNPAALAIAAAATGLCAIPAAANAAGYATTPGAYQANPSFVVTYAGAGANHTTFHATPPNPRKKPDTNDAKDTSRQSWRIRYRQALTVPACGPPPDGTPDPCAGLTGLSGARGPTSVTGRVRHKHVDGIYRRLDRTVNCRLGSATSKRKNLDATVSIAYAPDTQAIALVAHNPLATALTLFPTACPKQGDSIDRIFDFYATPGFSFAQNWGPDVWFESRLVAIPADVFHRSAAIRVPLALTKAGTPPRRCAVRDPSFERCKTGGSWSGRLTFTRR